MKIRTMLLCLLCLAGAWQAVAQEALLNSATQTAPANKESVDAIQTDVQAQEKESKESVTTVELAAQSTVQSTANSTTSNEQKVEADSAEANITEADIAEENAETLATESLGDTAFAAHDLSPWGMYQAADVVVKAVMIGLLLASIATWSVWLFKLVQLNISRRHAKQLLRHLSSSESFAKACAGLDKQNLEGQKKRPQPTDGSLQLVDASRLELTLSAGGPSSDEGLKERVLARLERVQSSLAGRMNQGTGVLATVGSVAPFVGLFGTVWGIMNSFIGIAQTQTTNLAVVAPGIAEALLATAIGLVAAIPAVIIYNHFSRAIGQYRALLADITTALMILISRDLDRQHPDAKPLADLAKTTINQSHIVKEVDAQSAMPLQGAS